MPPFSPAELSRHLDHLIAHLKAPKARPPTPNLHLPLSDIDPFITAALTHSAAFTQPQLLSDLVSLSVVPTAWPQPGLPALRDAAGPAAVATGVCGHVWKENELAYKCRTCERDPTCVICVPCFRRGNHEGHDYALVRTGGGCCDCGDIQAWRREGFCPQHMGASAECDDAAARLVPALRDRLDLAVVSVARAVLFLIAQMHCLVLESETELRATAERAVALLQWLEAVVSCGDAIRRAVTVILVERKAPCVTDVLCSASFDQLLELSTEDMLTQSWLDLVLRMDGVDRLPKVVAQALHELYFQLINDLVFKRRFLKSLVANYERYIHATVTRRYKQLVQTSESDEHIYPVDILGNFTVQLFTVPALIPVMIEKGGLLDVLLGLLLNFFEVLSSPVRAYWHEVPFQKTAFAATHPSIVPLVKRAQSVGPAFSTRASLAARKSTSQQPTSSNLARVINLLQENDPHHAFIAAQQLSTYILDRRERSSPTTAQPTNQASVNTTATQTQQAGNTGNDGVADVDGFMVPAIPDDGDEERNDVIAIFEDELDEDGQFVFVGPDNDDEDPGFERLRRDNDDDTTPPVTVEPMTQVEIDLRNGFQAYEQRRSAQIQRNQLMLRVFEDGLGFVPAKHTTIPTTASPHGHFRSCVANARKSTKAAVNGSGLMVHPLRVDLKKRQHIFIDTLLQVLKDLHYLIGHEVVAFHFVHERKDLLRLFLRMLSMCQGMNPISRRFGDHVPGEDETWKQTYTVEIEFHHLIDLIVPAFAVKDTTKFEEEELTVSKTTDEIRESRRSTVGLVLKCLDEWLAREHVLEQLSVYQDEDFTVSHSVSSHLPLHRLLSLLIHHVLRADGGTVLSLLGQNESNTPTDMAKRLLLHPLRLQSFFAQVRAGMWRKNGNSVMEQSLFYSSMAYSEWFVDLDLFLQQCCATVLGPRHFVDLVHRVFRIGDFAAVSDLAFSEPEVGQVSIASTANDEVRKDSATHIVRLALNLARHRDSSKTFHGLLPFAPKHLAETGKIELIHGVSMGNDRSELAKFSQTLVEELLVYFIRVSSERACCGHSEETLLRLRVVHQLCTRDKLYSHIMRTCSYRTYCALKRTKSGRDETQEETTQSVLELILSSVADFVKPKGMEQGRYRIRDAMWKEFDPFSPHLVKRDRCSAEVHRAAVCKRLNKKVQVIPEERICDRELYDQFRDLMLIPQYLCSSGPRAVATVAIEKANPKDDVAFTIEGVIPAALHLLCMTIEAGKSLLSPDTVLQSTALVDDVSRFSKSALGALCSVTTEYRLNFPELYAELGPVFERILNAAYDLGDPRVNSCLVHGAKHVLQSRVGSADATSISEGSSSKSPEEIRRAMLLEKKKERQAAAMAQMKKAQACFQKQITTDGDGDDEASDEDEQMTDLDGSRGSFDSLTRRESDCALCHGAEQSDSTNGLICLIGFRQKCALPYQVKRFCQNDGKPVVVEAASRDAHETDNSDGDGDGDEEKGGDNGAPVVVAERSPSDGPTWLRGAAEVKQNTHLSFCGHAVHLACFEKYFSTLLHSRDNRRMFVGYNVVNLDNVEFLCPVCRRLSNMLLPTLESLKKRFGLRSGPRKRLKPFIPGRAASIIDTYPEWVLHRDSHITVFARESSPGVETSEKVKVRRNEHSASGAGATTMVRGEAQSGTTKWVNVLRSALNRFSLFGMTSATGMGSTSGRTGSSRGGSEAQPWRVGDEGSVFGTHSKLAVGLAATAACLELATRSVGWMDSLLQHARRSVRLMFGEAREQIWVEAETRAQELWHVWREVRGREGVGGVDPFAVLCFLTILWPASLTRGEMRQLVRLALETMKRASGLGSGVGARQQLDELLFLRQAATLFATLFETEGGGHVPLEEYDEEIRSGEAVRSEAEALRDYLGLPKVKRPVEAIDMVRGARFLPVRAGLISLPGKLQTLLEQTDGHVCGKCSQRNAGAAVCLSCSAVVCASEACAGGMARHARECGCGVGVFLALRWTQVVILRGERTAKWGSPYLDSHGEEDQGLLRGRPLYLSAQRYGELSKLWLLAAFDQDSHVLNKTLLPLHGRRLPR